MVAVNGVRQGFRIPVKTALIKFEGTDYDGAEIKVRLSVSFARFIELRESAQSEDQEGMARLFGEHILMEWNLEDANGEPITADADGMFVIPMELTNLVMQHWVEAVIAVPGPLSETSGDISTLAAASTAMETG